MMRRDREAMVPAIDATMEQPHVYMEDWGIATVAETSWLGQITARQCLDANGAWRDATTGGIPNIVFGKTVGFRAKAKNITGIKAHVSIGVKIVKPDGTILSTELAMANVDNGGEVWSPDLLVTADQIGSYVGKIWCRVTAPYG